MKVKLCLLLLLATFAYVPLSQSTASSPLFITTTSILKDIVSNIVGDVAEVDTLIEIGVDPHDYQPSADDSRKINDADLVFFFGGGVEEVLTNTLESLVKSNKALEITAALPDELLIASNEKGHDYNPHIWMDPVIMKVAVENITDALIEKDPTNAASYTLNKEKYIEELATLHNSTIELISQIPDDNRFLVTQHGAFTYWANRYGFEYKSLEGISTSDEVSLQEIDQLANYLKENEVKVIYLETTVPDSQAQAVIQASEAIGWKVAVGGTLYSGSLGTNEASSYIGMMEVNAQTIVNGILNPPEGVGSIEVPLYFLPGIMVFAILVLIKRKEVKI